MSGGTGPERSPLHQDATAPETLAWLAELADRLPDLVVVAKADGTSEYINPAARRLLGFAPGETPTLRLHDLCSAEELEVLAGEALPAALRDGTWTGRMALVGRRGTSIPVLLTLNAHRDGEGHLAAMSLVGRDLRGLDDEVRERRRSESLFRAITENSLDLITLVDPYGATLYTTPAVERLLGYTPEEALRLDNWEKMHPEDVPVARQALERLLSAPSERITLTLRYRHKAGNYVPLEIEAAAHLDEPSLRGILLYARDISHRPPAAPEVRDLVQRLEQDQENRNVLLDKVAHDMKQPLSPIMLQVHLLRHLIAQDHPKAKRSLQIIEENSLRLERYIGDFRDLAQIERKNLDVQFEHIDLATRVASVVKSLHAEAETWGVRLDRACFGTFPVQADPDRIDQVLFNLIRNALKFTPAGGRVSVQVRRQDGHAACTVQDNGRGIDRDALDRIFEPFVQAHAPGESPEKGTGLGLSICRGIIERHEGRIWAESEGRGKGARLVFTLPLVSPQEDDP